MRLTKPNTHILRRYADQLGDECPSTRGRINCINSLRSIEFSTLEPPWENNELNISCIPEGEYFLTRHISKRHGYCVKLHCDAKCRYEPDPRSHILIHAGNFPRDTAGCILVGTLQDPDESCDLRNSKYSLEKLRDMIMDGDRLVIYRDPDLKS